MFHPDENNITRNEITYMIEPPLKESIKIYD